MHEVKESIKKEIMKIHREGINKNNLEMLGQLVDIHKDIANEEYWEAKEEALEMRGNYGEYGRGDYGRDEYGARGGRGNGRGGNRSGGRGRGSGTRYGDGRIYEAMDGWEEYKDYMDEYKERGSYGAKEKGLESLEYMLDCFVKWFEEIAKDAETQEEVDLVKKYANKIRNV